MNPSSNILIGPLFNPHVVGEYVDSPNIKIFASEPVAPEHHHHCAFTYQLEDLSHFNDLLAKLPTGWQPDIVIWWDVIYQALPPGVAECPYPTALIVGDWNLNFMAAWGYLSAFDWVFTEKRLCQYIQQAGMGHGHYWPGFSFEQALYPYPVADHKKPYDVTFVGNLNPYIHPERNRYLARLQRLSDSWRICIAYGVHGLAYRQLLADSRVVFNHSVRGEMNMRAYEAPAAGALLMLEAENQEIADFLTPGKSCLLYHQDDFEAQLNRILEQPEWCDQMAQQGHTQIQSCHYSAQFERMLALLTHPQPERQNNRWSSVSFIDQLLITTRQIFFAGTPQSMAYALRYLQKYLSSPEYQGLKQNAAVIHACATLQALMGQKLSQSNSEQAQSYWNQALEWWDRLWLQWLHPLVALNRGWTLLQQGDYHQALNCYEDALALLPAATAESLHLLAGFTLPGLSQATEDAFPVAWETRQIRYVADKSDYVVTCCQLLRWHIWQQLGHLRTRLGQAQAAIDAYRQAMLDYPEFGDTEWHLAKVLIAQGHENEAWQVFEQLLNRQPFFVSQIEELLTSHLLWHKREPLLALLTRYLQTIHTKDTEFQKHLSDLQALQQVVAWLCQLALQPPFAKQALLQQLITNTCPVRLAALLAPVFAHLPQTHRLSLPLALLWQVALPEPCPILAGDAHFYVAPALTDSACLTIADSTLKQGYQRTYTLEQTPQPHQLSPSDLPFRFPLVESAATLALPGWCKDDWSVLLITESLSSPLTQQLIMVIAGLAVTTDYKPQLLIWNPLGHLQHLDWLESHWPEQSDWQGLVLDEPLTPSEQGRLLQHIHLLVPTDGQWQTYYWYWALWQGTPLWLSPDWSLYPYGGVTPTMLQPFVHGVTGLSAAHNMKHYPAFKTAAQRCQQQLQHFESVEAAEIRWQTLWRLKATFLLG